MRFFLSGSEHPILRSSSTDQPALSAALVRLHISLLSLTNALGDLRL